MARLQIRHSGWQMISSSSLWLIWLTWKVQHSDQYVDGVFCRKFCVLVLLVFYIHLHIEISVVLIWSYILFKMIFCKCFILFVLHMVMIWLSTCKSIYRYIPEQKICFPDLESRWYIEAYTDYTPVYPGMYWSLLILFFWMERTK